MIQLQLLKGELAAVKKELAENSEENEVATRLQGALYLVAAMIFLVLLVQIFGRTTPKAIPVNRPFPAEQPNETVNPVTGQQVEVGSTAAVIHPIDKDETRGDPPTLTPEEPVTTPTDDAVVSKDRDDELTPASPEAAYDDPTPASPQAAYDDPTPMAPSMAYDDPTPANPSLAYQEQTTKEEENSNESDIHEVIHEISGRFKGMSDDKEASNLALARVYMDLGDYKQAKPLLTEVHKSVTPEYAQQAEEMIHELLQSEMFASSFNEIIDDLADENDSIVAKHLKDLSANNDPLEEVSADYLAHDGDDEASRELEMAQIFYELGDHARCKQHLAIILGSDNPSFKTEAYALLKEVESKEVHDNDMTTKSESLPDDIGDQPVIKEITPPDKTYNKEQLNELSSQFMAISTNKNGTKLALAHVHHEMGENEMTLKLLKEIISSDDDECRADAEALLKEIGDTNQA